MNYIERHCEMLPIVLNDSTYLCCGNDVTKYLATLGFDKFDIQTLGHLLYKDTFENAEEYKELFKEEERYSSHLYEDLNSFANEVEALADDLASGKGGTKAKYAERFKALAKFYQP